MRKLLAVLGPTFMVVALMLAPVVGCDSDEGGPDLSGPDMSAGSSTCGAIALCAQACGANATCALDCIGMGTTSGKTKFAAVQTCAYGVCTKSDGGTPNCSSATDTSVACLACVGSAAQSASCSTELAACLADK